MADVELVIKIDEEDYEIMKHNIAVNNPLCPLGQKEMVTVVANGIPLPKGHGRLIDTSYLLNLLKCGEYGSCTWKNCSDCNKEKCIRKHNILEAPTIIEADKAGEEE